MVKPAHFANDKVKNLKSVLETRKNNSSQRQIAGVNNRRASGDMSSAAEAPMDRS